MSNQRTIQIDGRVIEATLGGILFEPARYETESLGIRTAWWPRSVCVVVARRGGVALEVPLWLLGKKQERGARNAARGEEDLTTEHTEHTEKEDMGETPMPQQKG